MGKKPSSVVFDEEDDGNVKNELEASLEVENRVQSEIRRSCNIEKWPFEKFISQQVKKVRS